jgi:hypothetical protein
VVRCLFSKRGGKTLRLARSQIARARRKVGRVTHKPSQRVKKAA